MLKVLIVILFAMVCAEDIPILKENAKRKSLIPLLYDNSLPPINVTKFSNCVWLKGYKHQREQCQVRRGLEKVLLDTRDLTIRNCQQNFKYATWNCSYTKDQFKRLNRETAFMQSLAAAALMYEATEACSNKKLDKCKCDRTKEYLVKVPEYANITGCQDNTKSGRILARNFLMSQNHGKKAKTMNLNVKFGIRTVMESVDVHCWCSPTFLCGRKICEKRIQAFSNIMEKLKLGYHNAIKLKPKHLTSTDQVKDILPKNRLFYLVDSPNFCNFTAGRRCKDVANCATLCCGRGFNTRTITAKGKCNLRCTERCYEITYDICTEEQHIYECL